MTRHRVRNHIKNFFYAHTPTDDDDNSQLQPAQQDVSFQIVLVDIQQAAKEKEIHCVKKPLLGSGDLKFVALSYRWGELEETAVDTQCGYMANITSFYLNDFFALCKHITNEPDLQHMDYVWVDAICVNQADPVQRKATIHHMSTIYERANYVVAVPDLHRTYLEKLNHNNWEISLWIRTHSIYLYHLLHGHVDRLCQLDDNWLDNFKVPKHAALRQRLVNQMNHVIDGWMEHDVHDASYDPKKHLLTHFQKAMALSYGSHHRDRATRTHVYYERLARDESSYSNTYDMDRTPYKSILKYESWSSHDEDGDLDQHTQDLETATFPPEPALGADAAYDWMHLLIKEMKHDEWKQLIAEKSQELKRCMEFLTGIVKDWASRVWVISEYHIAKKKRSGKMKYWFIFLDTVALQEDLRFFEFDFENSNEQRLDDKDASLLIASAIDLYNRFHSTMHDLLCQQTFMGILLNSKASRSEDRFYSVLPLTEYRDKLISKDTVASWNIRTMLDVKLKLYELLTVTHRLALLFSSYPFSSNLPLPTFASTRLSMNNGNILYALDEQDNFDVSNDTTLFLTRMDSDSLPHFKLTLKPTVYFALKEKDEACINFLEQNRHLLGQLSIVDMEWMAQVLIPMVQATPGVIESGPSNIDEYGIVLLGNEKENKWILYGNSVDYIQSINFNLDELETCSCPMDGGFDIY